MKKLLIVLIGLSLVGCAGLQAPGTVYNQPCTIYEDVGATPANSLIAAKLKNPCIVHRILVTAAKLPVIWQKKEYVDLFDVWAKKIQVVIETGLTYKALQDLIIMEIAKFNQEAGLALLIIGDGIFIFTETDMIMPVDKKLLLMSLADLRQQVARLGILASTSLHNPGTAYILSEPQSGVFSSTRTHISGYPAPDFGPGNRPS